MAQGRATEIISMVKWIRTSRLTIEKSLSGRMEGWGVIKWIRKSRLSKKSSLSDLMEGGGVAVLSHAHLVGEIRDFMENRTLSRKTGQDSHNFFPKSGLSQI